MSVPVNLLFIASRSDIAGGETYLLSLFEHLDRARFTPIVMIPGEGSFSTKLAKMGIDTLMLEMNYGWLQPPQEWYPFLQNLPKRVKKLAAFIRERKIRLVHTNSSMILEGAMAARLAGIHHLYLAHTLFEPQLPVFQRFPLEASSFAELMGELSSAIVAVSEFVKQGLCPPLPAERVQVIHNGLDLNRYRRAGEQCEGGIRREFGVPGDVPLITAAGRINPDKGFEYFVEAAGQITSRFPEAHFIIAGATDSTAYATQLKLRIAELDLSNRFHLVGFRNDLPELLVESDIFVLSSRAEGASYVLIEAMACECAVVATRCGGYVEEVITHDESGLLVDYSDATGLAQAILQLVESPSHRRQVAQAGRSRIEDGDFNISQSTETLMSAYENLLARPAHSAGALGIDLFLRVTAETGDLGTRLTLLEDRLKTLEQSAMTRPDLRVRRWLKKWLKR